MIEPPTAQPPTAEEMQTLLREIHRQRERLTELVRTSAGDGTDELAAAIDEIGEHLLVADEELRVQNDELAQSSRRLDLLVAAHEELFANAPTAYLQTDADGVIVRVNSAARDLLGLSADTQRSRALANLVHAGDRAAVRALIGKVRGSVGGAAFQHSLEPVEASLVGANGEAVPVVLNVRRSSDGGLDRPLLHWELRRRVIESAVDPTTALGRPPFSAVLTMATAAADMNQEDTAEGTLDRIAQQARDAVRGCDEVGITLVRARAPGRAGVETPAATGELALACDQIQYDLNEGPCLGAIDDDSVVHIADLAVETRWPRFAPEAAQLGVASMLVLPLAAPRGTIGALNFYSRTKDAFDDDDMLLGRALATHATIALVHAEREANLRAGMATRAEIGRAVGILMERHKVSGVAAFDMLVFASQHSHRKLREVATWVEETGEDPSALFSRKSAGRQPT